MKTVKTRILLINMTKSGKRKNINRSEVLIPPSKKHKPDCLESSKLTAPEKITVSRNKSLVIEESLSADKSIVSKSSKHTKQFSKNQFQKKPKGKREHGSSDSKMAVKVQAKVPKKYEEFSANWKQLLSKLEAEKKTGSKSKKSKTYIHKKKQIKRKAESSVKASNAEIWFDDVDDILVDTLKKEQESKQTSSCQTSLVKQDSYQGVTKCVAMDCEMVGVGYEGRDSILARISIVNQYGQCLYDKFVKPTEKVTDYRTYVSGITPDNLATGILFKIIQKEVSDIITGKILVGHAIHNDLKVLYLDHPRKMIRDTSRYKPFRSLFQGRNPSLKKLCQKVLGVSVQEGEHDSVQDAQATMRLYTMYRKQWEKDIKTKFKKTGTKKGTR